MTSQNNKGELKKVSKRTFAPPVAKPNVLFAKGEAELLNKQEDAQAKEIPLSHRANAGAYKMVPKPTKPHDPKVNKKAQGKRWKGSTSIEKKANHEKDPDVTKNEEGCLTDSQFEEIVQSVLQKSLQDCMEDFGKRVVLAKPTDEQGLGRETLEPPPAAKDAVPGKASRDKSVMMLLEAEQKEHLPRSKKLSKQPANKDRKEKNEKPEADNGGRKESRKGAPKKKVQGNTRIIDQEEMREEEEAAADRGSGCSWCTAWAQCSYPTCKKWRRLSSDTDPSVLPEDWSCSQNSDLQHNSCTVPEETWSGSENEVVYAVYIPGSIVWAKQYGYPWWPGMVEADPDLGEYFLFSSEKDSLPSKYHVTFFGSSATRAWISASMLRNFGELDVQGNGLAKLKSKGDQKNFRNALQMAKEAEQISIQERIRMFGFCSRFSGWELPKDHNDLKDRVSTSRKPPHARSTHEPRSRSSASSVKDPEKLLGTPGKKLDGKLKTKANAKGFKKSFAVPQHMNPKAAEQQSSYTGSSTANLMLSSYPSKKDYLNKAETSRVEGSKRMLSKGLEEPGELMEVVVRDGEAALGSQEMAAFAEAENYSPEDFSLVFYEE